jgi:ribosome-binding factor A
MHGLRSAAGFVQTKVAERLTTRFVPHITFVVDEGVKKSIEIARLIREAREQDAAAHPAAEIAGEEGEDADAEDNEEPEHPRAPEQPGPADGPANRPD